MAETLYRLRDNISFPNGMRMKGEVLTEAEMSGKLENLQRMRLVIELSPAEAEAHLRIKAQEDLIKLAQAQAEADALEQAFNPKPATVLDDLEPDDILPTGEEEPTEEV